MCVCVRECDGDDGAAHLHRLREPLVGMRILPLTDLLQCVLSLLHACAHDSARVTR